jgi:diaminopimelate epimerase
MSGCGNDFVIVDNRDDRIPEGAKGLFARNVCLPHLSLGADGVMFIERSRTCDLRMRLFNPDASEGEMCGNGARCMALVAWRQGMAPRRMTLETRAGVVEAVVRSDSVAIRVPVGAAEVVPLSEVVRDPQQGGRGQGRTWPDAGFFVPVGVPHLVIPLPDAELLDRLDVEGLGRRIRSWDRFPQGTNVDFMAGGGGRVRVRTYERGVERETYACGSGAVAAALVAESLGWVASPVTVSTRGGTLIVSRETEDERRVWLSGPVATIAYGQLFRPAWSPHGLKGDGGEKSWCAS